MRDIDAVCTPVESRALRLLTWAITAPPAGTSFDHPTIKRMVYKARALPRVAPSSQCALATSISVALTCPKVGAVLQCPSSRAVAVSLSRISGTVSAHMWMYRVMSGGYVDTEVDADVGELLVCCVCALCSGLRLSDGKSTAHRRRSLDVGMCGSLWHRRSRAATNIRVLIAGE